MLAREDDTAIARCDHAPLDHTKIGQIRPKSDEPGIVPDTIEALGSATSLDSRSWRAYMSIHIIVSMLCPPVWKHVHAAFRISTASLRVGG